MESYRGENSGDVDETVVPRTRESSENMQGVARRLFSPAEVRVMLDVSRDTLFGLLRNRELRSMKVGRLRRIPAEAIDEYVARKMAESDAEGE